MRFLFMFALAFGGAPALGDDWTPPENPDPQVILLEARVDTQAKRYEIALAKHVWFHEHALTINRALTGVRLSFALSDWNELASEYPPALTKLREIRDQAHRNVMEGMQVGESFRDMASINRTLDEDSLTKDTFEALDAKRPEDAQAVFEVAKPSLVRTKAYALFAKYLDPKRDLAGMRANYRFHKKLADDPRFGALHLDFANKKFANDATTLVAILAVNHRNKEAEEIAATARAEWDDSSFHAGLAKALKGEVPDPWP